MPLVLNLIEKDGEFGKNIVGIAAKDKFNTFYCQSEQKKAIDKITIVYRKFSVVLSV